MQKLIAVCSDASFAITEITRKCLYYITIFSYAQ